MPTKKWTKREARQEARRYAAALLAAQDDMPDWVQDAGIPPELYAVFNDEMQRLADRIRATINKANMPG